MYMDISTQNMIVIYPQGILECGAYLIAYTTVYCFLQMLVVTEIVFFLSVCRDQKEINSSYNSENAQWSVV